MDKSTEISLNPYEKLADEIAVFDGCGIDSPSMALSKILLDRISSLGLSICEVSEMCDRTVSGCEIKPIFYIYRG